MKRPSESFAPSPTKEVAKYEPEILLIIFIHGFKGTDETFGSFPSRLQHMLSESISQVSVECIVFPAYETEAVVRFADWLTTLTVEKEVACGGGAGKAKIVLCGHSMGGLLVADSLLEFAKSRPDSRGPLWPKIIACIAFDTPYLGLHPFVFKNKATEFATTAQTVGSALLGSLAGLRAGKAKMPETPASPGGATQPPTSVWGKWAPAAYAVGGAVLAGAAAGGAYYKREDLGVGYAWATDHMKYIRTLWDEEALARRVDSLIDMEEQEGVLFRTFYTYLPPSPPVYQQPMTFIVLPKKNSRAPSHFLPAKNELAPDELQAHTGMFDAKTNDGYYELGLAAARIIREAVMLGRGIFEDTDLGNSEPPRNTPATPTPPILPRPQIDGESAAK
ncbi:hypothetical protein BD779DRAFT_1432913 [Infundibulicybe gibba]|nr:hypothetical protein BD779DRAFT_1432913 [Infundibulicybe gibba]